jgi:glutathione S-transferase
MITIHHLGVSQSDRIVWLMEELKLPYRLEWYDRGPDGLLPPAYLTLHPAATAPVITDGDLVLPESAAIVEYISHRYGEGRLSVAPERPNYPDYLYWMHFNNNVQGLFFAGLASRAQGAGDAKNPVLGFIERRESGYYRHLDQRLGESPYLAGPDFTCADLMVTFNLTTLSRLGGRSIDDLPHVAPYLERITRRPAYMRAMSIAGPTATRPNA